MLPKTTPKLTATEILHLLEEARNAEKLRDLKSLREILENFWSDFNEIPDFDIHQPHIKAELLRISGSFLTFYAISKGLKNLQPTAKNLLTQSVELFETLNLPEKVAEANIYLGFCYWNCGEVSEYEAVYNCIEMEFEKSPFHPISLLLSINRLVIFIYCEKKEKSLKLIKEILLLIDYSEDKRIKAMFHSMAAVAFRHSSKYADSAYHFKEAIRFSQELKIIRFEAINYNNLSLLYKNQGMLAEANDWAEKSYRLFLKLEDKGWISHVLDTKALICLDEKDYSNALELSNESLSYFYQGEDYNGLTAALWTKVRCLLRLERIEEALNIFVELEQTALEHIGEIAVKKFVKNLSEEIYILRHLPLSDEIAEFKKARVSAALTEANGVIGKAAKILGLKNHQALSEILNKQFPELLDELGFKRRARRTSEKRSKATESNSAETQNNREIYRLILTDKHFSFDFKLSSPQFETFYFDRYLMRQFGVDSSAIIAVVPVKKIKAGMLVITAEEDKFSAGKVEYDEWVGIYFISDEEGDPIPIDEENIAGEAIGFCPFSKSGNQYIQFSRLKS